MRLKKPKFGHNTCSLMSYIVNDIYSIKAHHSPYIGKLKPGNHKTVQETRFQQQPKIHQLGHKGQLVIRGRGPRSAHTQATAVTAAIPFFHIPWRLVQFSFSPTFTIP